MTPESEEMNENSNIYAIYEKMMVEKYVKESKYT